MPGKPNNILTPTIIEIAASDRLQHEHEDCSVLGGHYCCARTMNSSAEMLILAAKLHQIEELMQLAAKTRFVGLVGHLIHTLQNERGAMSLFLASTGTRFGDRRRELVRDTQSAERHLRAYFESQPGAAALGNAKCVSLAAWVLLGMDDLPSLRSQIDEHRLTAAETVSAYSHLIAGLIALIFEVADATIDPRISRLLVALFNLVQGKEMAGQERAVGALSFASGVCDGAHQQRIMHLIGAQERHFQLFGGFAGETLANTWQQTQSNPCIALQERLRRLLCNSRAGAALDAGLSDRWFECCSERQTAIWSLQRALVDTLRETCVSLVSEARSELSDSERMVTALRAGPPPRAWHTREVHDPAIPVEGALNLTSPTDEWAGQGHSAMDLLRAQSQRLASLEAELATARRALDERKMIERAKGILMARFNLDEDEAYKRMRAASMEQNRRLVEIAEAILALTKLS